jgi:hypothetical protein
VLLVVAVCKAARDVVSGWLPKKINSIFGNF